MINLFNFWYQRGWHLIDETEYQKAYENWGGSLITHPVFIRKLSNHLSISSCLVYELEYDSKLTLNISQENLRDFLYEMKNDETKNLIVEVTKKNEN